MCKEEITEVLNHILVISGYQNEVCIDDQKRLLVLERETQYADARDARAKIIPVENSEITHYVERVPRSLSPTSLQPMVTSSEVPFRSLSHASSQSVVPSSEVPSRNLSPPSSQLVVPSNEVPPRRLNLGPSSQEVVSVRLQLDLNETPLVVQEEDQTSQQMVPSSEIPFRNLVSTFSQPVVPSSEVSPRRLNLGLSSQEVVSVSRIRDRLRLDLGETPLGAQKEDQTNTKVPPKTADA